MMIMHLKNLTVPAVAIAFALAVNPIALAEPTTSETLTSIAMDSSPEEQAIRDALVSQWEADAIAAGIDPDTASADSGDDSAPAQQ
jgi:hypothetical protein